MNDKRSHFIVLEGLDGAGTTTQAKLLHSHCTQSGLDSFLTYEPTAGPIGTLIRDYLSGRIPGPDGQPSRLAERELCLLFGADRLEHSREIENRLNQGEHVVCDRYVLSSMAYQSLDPGVSGEWVARVNQGCSIPDLTIFLDVPVDECLRRISARNEDSTIYERSDLLQRIAENYESLRGLYEEKFGPLLVIDGTGAAEEVHEAVVSHSPQSS